MNLINFTIIKLSKNFKINTFLIFDEIKIVSLIDEH